MEYYARSTLETKHQKIYDAFYVKIRKLEDKISINKNLNYDECRKIVECISADHPEIYWFGGLLNFSNNGTIQFRYYNKVEEIKKQLPKMKAIVKKYKEKVFGLSDYQKVKYAYELVCKSIDYGKDRQPETNEFFHQTIEGVFIHSKAVCAGFARGMQLLLQKVGIESLYVTGNAEGELHAWVMAKLEGEWYHFDPTYAHSTIESGNLVNYQYFGMTDEDSLLLYKPSEGYVGLPKCTSVTNNYFYKENRLNAKLSVGQTRYTTEVRYRMALLGIGKFPCTTYVKDDDFRTILIAKTNLK
ncbi:MAG: hypothetical protein LBN08_00635 [Lactobacillales bacterium]|jgi:hypothetical protein|nr:hypothetical protein [Lactobacillales bacterium]